MKSNSKLTEVVYSQYLKHKNNNISLDVAFGIIRENPVASESIGRDSHPSTDWLIACRTVYSDLKRIDDWNALSNSK